MLTGLIVGFVTWSVYLLVQILIVAWSIDQKELEPKRLLKQLFFLLLAGVMWGGIFKYAITGSPH